MIIATLQDPGSPRRLTWPPLWRGIILIALNEVVKLAHCGWHHSLGWDPGLNRWRGELNSLACGHCFCQGITTTEKKQHSRFGGGKESRRESGTWQEGQQKNSDTTIECLWSSENGHGNNPSLETKAQRNQGVLCHC